MAAIQNRWWLYLVLLATSEAAAQPSRRPPPAAEPARRFSEQGLAAHERGDHDAAAKLFQRAQQLRPSALVLSFLAREQHELAAYAEAQAAASGCLETLDSGPSLTGRLHDEVKLSCLWFRADSMYQQKDLAAAARVAAECVEASRGDQTARNRDAVFLDCERLARVLAPLNQPETPPTPPTATPVPPAPPPAKPLYRHPALWSSLGAAAAAALAVGLGVGLRPPADPTEVRTVQFLLRF